MKKSLSLFFLLAAFCLGFLACTSTASKGGQRTEVNRQEAKPNRSIPISTPSLIQASDSLRDSRDGTIYATIQIGSQIWMAENLRYKTPDSKTNPDFPSLAYGSLYDGARAQTVCPEGWHLPTDSEWNKMEMVLGMPAVDTASTSWRGAHGTQLKSVDGWTDGEAGSNSAGFNGLPAGFYFDDGGGIGDLGFDGLGSSVGYWAGTKGPRAWLRFLGGPLEGVNRFDDDKASPFFLACRCVRD